MKHFNAYPKIEWGIPMKCKINNRRPKFPAALAKVSPSARTHVN